MELPNIAAYAYQDVHVWSALMTCCGPRNSHCNFGALFCFTEEQPQFLQPPYGTHLSCHGHFA